ncbi:MucR family transcriptional regulator [Methylobacterium planeticum]|uniref:MucR family transcriptional regulator n=1 Tax=Methylobacterium planeticum TaxID=2615211 RepID=A0A6N6MH49_9HYPH|nr:MucR family transcriptional regulator [Methylobacterium planeticum]KAB1068275.1 MucR family transcriptional regulator [Methylobacterium planeticum]
METEGVPSHEADHLTDQAADIVAAYVTRNHVSVSELPGLIQTVHTALVALTQPPAEAAEPSEKVTTAQVRKSITPDHLVSFIDGKPYKTLKRHLSAHGLDVYGYRARFGLPADYPMVAANYAAQRSELAKNIGLGRPGAQQPRTDPPKRGRRKVA